MSFRDLLAVRSNDGAVLLRSMLFVTGASLLPSPAEAQSMRFDVVGSVAPRCSAISPKLDLTRDPGATANQVGLSVTLRCNGPAPALTMRVEAISNSGEAVDLPSGDLRLLEQSGRPASDIGNVRMRVPSEMFTDQKEGGIEIVVAPAA